MNMDPRQLHGCEVLPPMVPKLKARLVHFAKPERIRNEPRELADGRISHHDTRLRRCERLFDDLQHFRHVRFGEARFVLKGRVSGILEFESLIEQPVQRVTQSGCDRRFQFQFAERLEVIRLIELVGGVGVLRHRRSQPVERFDLVAELIV